MIHTGHSELQEHIIQQILDSLYQQYRTSEQGEIATYIPELSKANPAHFGLSVVTKNGQLFEAGDSSELFTIQSISKPFTYGMALEELTWFLSTKTMSSSLNTLFCPLL